MRDELFQIFGTSITPLKIIWVIVTLVLLRVLLMFMRAFVFKTLQKYEWFDEGKGKQAYRISKWLLMLLGAVVVINILDLQSTWKTIMETPLLETGEGDSPGIHITFGGLLIFLLVLAFAVMIARLITSALGKQLTRNKRLDDGQRFTIVKLVRYALYVVAFLFAANSAGVDLRPILVGSAALLVGLGLALQHIFDDVISGFIILFEGTFQVGDIIQTEGMIAKVVHIDIRTSKVMTQDGNVIIVPNRMLTSEKLDNWSHSNVLTRYHVTVGVSYGSDVEKVRKLMYQAALAHTDVSKNKPITIRFDDFGDSALIFRVFFWANRAWDNEILLSDLRFAIIKAFRDNGVEIPFPQRDLHIRSAAGLVLEGEAQAPVVKPSA